MARVVLQAGHSATFAPYRSGGGGAPGEAAWTADLALRIASRLGNAGVTVDVVGSWLSGQTVYAPPDAMKRDADLFVPLHYDSDTYAVRTGAFADRYEYDTPQTAVRSLRALAAWEAVYPKATGIPLKNERRNVNTARYYGYRAKTPNTPALLIEHGVGQGWDKTILFDRIDVVADADASAILAYLGVPEVTPQQQQILDSAAKWQIDDGGELDFLMGTRQTLAEQVASLEQLKTTAQAERDAYMAEVARLKEALQNATQPIATRITRVQITATLEGGSTQELEAVAP
jgi:hypothetical protein